VSFVKPATSEKKTAAGKNLEAALVGGAASSDNLSTIIFGTKLANNSSNVVMKWLLSGPSRCAQKWMRSHVLRKIIYLRAYKHELNRLD
jgi:hypothetical protein